MIPHIHPCRSHRGLTLLEVLIAVVILSIGLLGLANLQLIGLEATDNSYRRSMATYIANDLADRMRANRVAARSGAYDTLDSDSLTPPSDPGCISTGCTPTEMAQLDMREWLDHFVDVDSSGTWVAALAAGRGRVQRSGDRIRIVITWINTETGWDSSAEEHILEQRTQTFDVEFEL